MPHTRRSVLGSIGASTALLTAGTAGATSTDARVRVLHASPDAPAVDVFVDGSKVLASVTFKTVSDYLAVAPGTYDVEVAPAGAGVGNAVIDTELTVEADTDYTVAAVNRLANIAPAVFVDDNDATPGRGRLRAVHLSPDAGAVDVAVSDGPGVEEPQVVVPNLSYRNATGYLELLPTDYGFEIRPAGGENAVFEFGANLDPLATYTAFAVGLLGESGDEAFDVVLASDDRAAPTGPGVSAGRGSGRGR